MFFLGFFVPPAAHHMLQELYLSGQGFTLAF